MNSTDNYSVMVLITKKTFYGMGQMTEVYRDHYFEVGNSQEEVVGKVYNTMRGRYKDDPNGGISYSFDISVLEFPNTKQDQTL